MLRRVRVANIIGGLSLAICLAFVPLWVRSYWTRDTLMYTSEALHGLVADSSQGRIVLSMSTLNYRFEFIGLCLLSRPATSSQLYCEHFLWRRFGFAAQKSDTLLHVSYELGLPYWFVICLVSVVPVWLYIRPVIRQRWRRRHGLCAYCGYDLRATAERCPECGSTTVAQGRCMQREPLGHVDETWPPINRRAGWWKGWW